MCKKFFLMFMLFMTASFMKDDLLMAEDFVPNYDENKIPAYTLPDPLTMNNGTKCVTAHDWVTKRRAEVFNLIADQEYGFRPALAQEKNNNIKISYDLVEKSDKALNGKAVRKQIVMTISRGEKSEKVDLLIYQPITDKPVPVFLGLNFKGNHTIHTDPEIRISPAVEEKFNRISKNNSKAKPVERGEESTRWPVELITSRGYAVATMYYDDITPDHNDGLKFGVHALFYENGETEPANNQWGAIGSWGWALSKALDYLETDKSFDATKVAVLGHSRLGKTSLWAGAYDERFAMAISNDSGCGGAALAKRAIGETVGRINNIFPHWFCRNFRKYNNNESALPFDQHELIALIAPRPVYIASATEDLWADPKGEFLSGLHAEPVYALFGKAGLGTRDFPAPDQPLKKGYIGYHNRTGKHDITEYDWTQYMDFADLHFKKQTTSTSSIIKTD